MFPSEIEKTIDYISVKTQKQQFTGVLLSSCSKTFRKTLKTLPTMEFFCLDLQLL